MKTELRPGETITREGAANLQKNIETVGGKLYLTSQRLIFEAHKFNIQGGIMEIDLSTIQSLRPCWTRFLGLVPIFPNALAISTQEGKEHRFTLFDRHGWSKAIEMQMNESKRT